MTPTVFSFLGGSISSLGGSQLIRSLNWTIPDIFLLVSGILAVGGVLFLLMYHFVGKKFDRHLIAELDEKYPDRWQQDSQDFKSSPPLDKIFELNAKVAHI